jgi:hypothetical protein
MRVLKIGYYSFPFDDSVDVGSIINNLSKCQNIENAYIKGKLLWYKADFPEINISSSNVTVFGSREEAEKSVEEPVESE